MIIKQKTGFEVVGKAAVNCNGTPFYHFTGADEKQKIQFNLPPGKYEFLTPFKILEKPVNFTMPKARKREHFHPLPKPGELKVIYGNNPNKASIFPKKHVIIFDSKYKNAPQIVKDYLLFHELGHYLYKSEKFADEYAQAQLIEKGYPLSMIVKAAEKTLYNGHERHNYCFENMKKVKKNG
jgi:hypothetical protein